MIFVSKWYFFVLLNTKLVCPLYFTMSNIEGIIPVLNGKSVAGKIFPLYATESQNVTYSIKVAKESPTDLLKIDEKTGDLYFLSSGIRNVSAEVIAQDYLNDASSSHLAIITTPCDRNTLENICFWSKVTYQIKRTSTGTYLGTLAPSSDLGGCPIKNINYEILTGAAYLKLQPPDNNTKFWMLRTSEGIENFIKNVSILTLYSNIRCTLETPKKPATYTKQLEVHILDNDFSSSDPLENNIIISLNDGHISEGYVNITLSLEKKYKKRSAHYFKLDNKIFRTAAPYARVTQPINYMKNITNYQIKVINSNRDPFGITNEGIVYVYDFLALRNSPEHLRVNITWSQNNTTQHEEINVRAVDEPNITCESMSDIKNWTFCAQFENRKSCVRKDSCALGTGGRTSVVTRSKPQRCMWRGDTNPGNHQTHMYSTCSEDTEYCPDGVCDSLEALNEDELCPQDCSKRTTFPTKLNPKTGQGVDKCNGVLVCDLGCFCHVKNVNETSIAQIQENKLVVERKCDLKCIMGSVGGIVLLISIIFFILIFWRINHAKKLTKEKYIHNIQEVETPFADYIDRNIINEPLVLNFNMTTMFDNTNSNCNTLKTNEMDSKWEFPRTQICIEQILGEGEFGKVLKAKAFNIAGRPGYSLVAVKTLKDDARKQDYSDLFSEYQLLKEVSHPHVIQLLGVCSSDDGPLYVIIEYAKFGSLRNYLRRSRHILTNTELANLEENLIHKVTPRDILSFARQISSGMAYLSDIKLVHRDLAARNILLTENKICRVSDFGLTRDIYEDNAYFKKSKGRVPVKWMAPESLADHVYTTKSDVWSFGILIWELVTLGASPYPGIPVHNLYNLLKEGYRMEKPANSSTVLYSLMNRCWNIDPEERPQFLDLYHCFDSLLTDNMNYLDLSDNAITNKSYFSVGAETGISQSLGANINLLKNYPRQKKSLENKDKTYNLQENKSCVGYETPVKTPRRITTPTNEMPEEYTDMNFNEEK